MFSFQVEIKLALKCNQKGIKNCNNENFGRKLMHGSIIFFSKANGSGESSQLCRGYSSLSLTFFAKTICDVQNDMVCAMGVYQYPEKAQPGPRCFSAAPF